MKRFRTSSLLVVLATLASNGAFAAVPRGTPERLERAKQIRVARAGKAVSLVTPATAADHESMIDILALRSAAAFQPFTRILFLSDGNHPAWQSLAEPVASRFPEKLVIKGDYDIPGARRGGNFVAMHIDNRERLPLQADSVDLVVMRRGMCLCHGATMCGGLDPNVRSVRGFMRNVYRVLDKSTPNAVAYLHGSHGGAARLAAFRRAADELRAQYPSMRVEFVEQNGVFEAIKISHAPPASPAQS